MSINVDMNVPPVPGATAILVRVADLTISPINPRKSVPSEKGIDELAANIRDTNYQLINWLVVHKTGKKGSYGVAAGQRRMAALQRLLASGEISQDHEVGAWLVTKEQAQSLALMENTAQEPMHPVDEYEAFSGLIAKRGVEAVAKAYGRPKREVQQLAKLGSLSEEVRQAYRNGEITAETARLLTMAKDKRAQVTILNALKAGTLPPSRVKEQLCEGALRGDDKIAVLTIERYRAAGHVVREDLFSQGPESIYLDDRTTALGIALDMMREFASGLSAMGWQNVEVSLDDIGDDWPVAECPESFRPANAEEEGEISRLAEYLSRLVPQMPAVEWSTFVDIESLGLHDDPIRQTVSYNHRLAAEKAAMHIVDINRSRALYPEELHQTATVLVTIGESGRLTYSVHKEDDTPVSEADEADSDFNEMKSSPPVQTGGSDEDEGFSYSQTLTQALGDIRTQIASAAIARSPTVADALLCTQLLLSSGFQHHETFSRVTMTPRRFLDNIEPCAASRAIAEMKTKAKREFKDLKPVEIYKKFLEMSEQERNGIRAYLVSLTLDVPMGGDALFDTVMADADCITEQWYRPTAKDYLGRVSHARLMKDFAPLGSTALSRLRKLSRREAAFMIGSWIADPESDEVKNLADVETPLDQIQAHLRHFIPEGVGYVKQ